jgi:hypothetical protein
LVITSKSSSLLSGEEKPQDSVHITYVKGVSEKLKHI